MIANAAFLAALTRVPAGGLAGRRAELPGARTRRRCSGGTAGSSAAPRWSCSSICAPSTTAWRGGCSCATPAGSCCTSTGSWAPPTPRSRTSGRTSSRSRVTQCHRDIDPRPDGARTPGPARGGTGASDDARPSPADDSRDVFSRDLDLPRGPSASACAVRVREYTLRGSEVADAGDGRRVSRRPRRRSATTRASGRTVLRKGPRAPARRGPDPDDALRRRARAHDARDADRTGPRPARSATSCARRTSRRRPSMPASRRAANSPHDAQVYRAYLRRRRTADRATATRPPGRARLRAEARVPSVPPGAEPRTARQRRTPERDAAEIPGGRSEHHLPMVDDHVQFPDVRIEYEGRDGRRDVEDVEVMTPHYRGAHAAAKARPASRAIRAMGRARGRRTGLESWRPRPRPAPGRGDAAMTFEERVAARRRRRASRSARRGSW